MSLYLTEIRLEYEAAVKAGLRDSYAWGMVPDDAGTLSTYAGSELRYWLRHQQPFGGWISFQYSGWYDETAIASASSCRAARTISSTERL